jgi:hypothetical protein
VLRRIARKVEKAIGPALLTLRIRRKWISDRRQLPLTAVHWELYDIIHRHYWFELHDLPNLISCRDFNDRIQWLKLFDQSAEIIRCSDKITAREFIRERVGEKYLLELYQTCDHYFEIDFEALPSSFVIKTNHDSGTVIPVADKGTFDFSGLENRIERSLRNPYGWEYGEWAYSYIRPGILVEEFIQTTSGVRPIDYKFYVIDGTVKFCHVIFDRGVHPKEQTVGPGGNDLATELFPSFELCQKFSKPANWDEMIEVASRIGNGFKCVRVDLYCEDNRILAGEMTFWPQAGRYKGAGQKILGQYLDFDRKTFKPYLCGQLERTCSRFELYPATHRRNR